MCGGNAEEELYQHFSQAQQGDEEALNRLLGTMRPILLREIRRRIRSAMSTQARAEELAQDALVRVAEGLPSCRARSEAQLRAWCRTIARRIVIDWHRRRAAEKERKSPAALADAVWTSAKIGRRHDAVEEPTGFSREVEQVLGRLLLEAQDALSEGTQEVLRHRLLYGSIWREAGHSAGTTAGGAKRRYQRATERLRREVLERIHQVADEHLRRKLLQRVGENP